MSEWTSLAEAHEILSGFADPNVGIVCREIEKLVDMDEALGHSTGAHVGNSQFLTGAKSNKFNGGAAPGKTQARLAGIGESIERYSAGYVSYVGEDGFIFASANEMVESGKNVIGPDELPLFHQRQYSDKRFRFSQWTPEMSLWWYRGLEASAGDREVWAPAQLLFLAPPARNEPRIAYSTSNGLAAGIKPVEAYISALFEAVERDAVMLTWYNRLSMPHVDTESSPELSRYLSRHILPTGLDLHLIDLSTFSGIPTVLGVVRNPNTSLAPIALGAASAATLARACEKAAFESIYTRSWVKAEQREGNSLESDDWFSDIQSFDDHIRLYAGTSLVPAADFLTSNTSSNKISDSVEFGQRSPTILWANLVQCLSDQGSRVCVFDMSSPDIVEGGASVAKVLIPGHCQLDALYEGRWLGSPRFRNRAYELGLVDRPQEWDDLNHVPHPFP